MFFSSELPEFFKNFNHLLWAKYLETSLMNNSLTNWNQQNTKPRQVWMLLLCSLKYPLIIFVWLILFQKNSCFARILLSRSKYFPENFITLYKKFTINLKSFSFGSSNEPSFIAMIIKKYQQSFKPLASNKTKNRNLPFAETCESINHSQSF